jgi:hypothetical protein
MNSNDNLGGSMWIVFAVLITAFCPPLAIVSIPLGLIIWACATAGDRRRERARHKADLRRWAALKKNHTRPPVGLPTLND